MYSTSNTSASYYQTAYDKNGYGGMAYYTSTTCGHPTAGTNTYVTTGCTTDYAQSEVKYVVDGWALDKFQSSDLKADATGYSARLITYDDLTDNLGYEQASSGTINPSTNGETTPSWVYNSNYSYWTMSQYNDSVFDVWYVNNNGNVSNGNVSNGSGVVRPVVTLLKSAL